MKDAIATKGLLRTSDPAFFAVVHRGLRSFEVRCNQSRLVSE
jgi:hypothetical protein